MAGTRCDMDELLKGLSTSIADAGPGYVMVFGILVIFVSKMWPDIMKFIAERDRRMSEIEAKREERKVEEGNRRLDFEKKSVELQGRWLEQYEHATKVQEQTNSIISEVQLQLSIQNAALAESSKTSAGIRDEILAVRSKFDKCDVCMADK